MSDTPRTNEMIIASGFQAVPLEFQDFARQLEREIAVANARIAVIKDGWNDEHNKRFVNIIDLMNNIDYLRDKMIVKDKEIAWLSGELAAQKKANK